MTSGTSGGGATTAPGPSAGAGRLLAAAAVLAGHVVLLVTLPATQADDPPGAAVLGTVGYDGAKAHLCVLAWTAVAIAVLAVTARRWGPAVAPAESGPRGDGPGPTRRAALLECGVVFAVFVALYFPLFLARYGPYVEDAYFLAVLQRMHSGQIPYVDFEFLYGPLMVVPLRAWISVAGLSMVSYYSFLALLEAFQFAALMGVLQRWIPGRARRYAVFLVMTAFLFNTLLGMNWNGMRRLVPVFIILLVVGQPGTRARLLAGGALLGLQLAYSHEYGVACFAAIAGTFALMLFRGEGRSLVKDTATLGITAFCVWLASSALAMGADFPAYIHSTRAMLKEFSAGASSFRFYWTVNSLALFALLCLACTAVGPGLLRRPLEKLAAGDRLLLASLLYALVTLRSGLNRADFWHLTAPFLPLIVVGLLPLPYSAFDAGRTWRRAFVVVVGLASATYLVGSAPTGSYYFRGLQQGARDTLSGKPKGPDAPAPTRVPSIQLERTRPLPEVLALGVHLAAPGRTDRPVFFYGVCWTLPQLVGVVRDDYLVDDFMYLDALRPSEAYLRDHPDAIVVMRRTSYERLYGLRAPDDFPENEDPANRSLMKQATVWLTSVHITGVDEERPLKERLWRQRCGDFIRAHYAQTAEFGVNVVLERRE